MIKGIRSSMIVERVTGNDASVLPVKQKYISELTDEDIYTFVTLRDCEFAVRKGSLTPCTRATRWPTRRDVSTCTRGWCATTEAA